MSKFKSTNVTDKIISLQDFLFCVLSFFFFTVFVLFDIVFIVLVMSLQIKLLIKISELMIRLGNKMKWSRYALYIYISYHKVFTGFTQ